MLYLKFSQKHNSCNLILCLSIAWGLHVLYLSLPVLSTFICHLRHEIMLVKWSWIETVINMGFSCHYSLPVIYLLQFLFTSTFKEILFRALKPAFQHVIIVQWLLSSGGDLNCQVQMIFRIMNYLCLFIQRASLIAQLVKNVPAMQETPVRFLGQEDPLEKG